MYVPLLLLLRAVHALLVSLKRGTEPCGYIFSGTKQQCCTW